MHDGSVQLIQRQFEVTQHDANVVGTLEIHHILPWVCRNSLLGSFSIGQFYNHPTESAVNESLSLTH
jgi:hypothetical protein